jgi:agmatinase
MPKSPPSDTAIHAPDLKTVWAEPAYSGVTSFFRRRYVASATGADVAVLGIPLDVATSYRPGARFGPQAIRRVSALFEPIDPVWPFGTNPFETHAVVDLGDVAWDKGHPEMIVPAIEHRAAAVIGEGARLLSLGGDHFATYPLLRAHAARQGALALVQFDAHQDTWDDDGARIDHGTFVTRAAREGLIDPARSIQIGIRTLAPDTRGIEIIDAEAVMRRSVDGVVEAIRARVGAGPVYLSFDIDALDPAFAPGTGTPVPGGMTSREALAVLRGLSGLAVVGADVVEVSPPYDHADMTANAAAAIAQTLVVLLTATPRS